MIENPAESEVSWFAMRVYMNKVARCRDVFNVCNNVLLGVNEPPRDFPEDMKGDPMQYYAPFVVDSYVNNHGKRVTVEKPFIPSLFFLRSTTQQAIALEGQLRTTASLYRHHKDGVIQPVAIPHKQMEMFVKATQYADERVDIYEDGAFKLKKGVRVRVIGGKFEGLEGEVKRINGDHRLIVQVEGVCTVATAHIPRAYLEKIE